MLTIFTDPGRSNGIVLGHYSETEPWTRLAMWQVEGGASGLSRWLWGQKDLEYGEAVRWEFHPTDDGNVHASLYDEVEFYAEKWVPYPTPGHSATLDSTYPLVVEGVLINEGLMPDEFPHPRWNRSGEQYFSGGTTKAEKRRLSKEFLKSVDLYATGKDVGCKDAEDVISATLQQLATMRKMRHMPTMRHYWPSEMKEES